MNTSDLESGSSPESGSVLKSGPFLETFLQDVFAVAADVYEMAVYDFVRGIAGFVAWALLGGLFAGSVVTDAPSEAATRIVLRSAGWTIGGLVVGSVLLWATTPRKIRRTLFPKRWDVSEIFNKGSSEEIVRYVTVWATSPLWAGPAYIFGVSFESLWVTFAVSKWALGVLAAPFQGIYRRSSRVVRAFRDVLYGLPSSGAE